MSAQPCVKVEILIIGALENNVYIIEGSDATVVVDPTASAKRIKEALGDRKLDAIFITHGHFDHANGAKELRELTGAPVIASAIDAPIIEGDAQLKGSHPIKPCPVDRTVEDGDIVEVGSMRWEVMLTPGHTRGSICLYLDPRYGADPDGAPVLVSGDTLFQGTHGRTDFDGGSLDDMAASLTRIIQLPEETVVLPGHAGATTIAAERRTFGVLLYPKK